MIYFFSDTHLGLGLPQEQKERQDLVLSFLHSIQHDCEKLFIVGDLFDYWFEYNTVIPRPFYRILSALYEMVQQNIQIEYLMGNHDFGHQNFFRDELGIPVHATDKEYILHGKKFYIAHGDGKAYNDTGYLILRRILRSPVNKKLFQFLHPDMGIALASGASHSSRAYTDQKEYGQKKDGLRDFAEKKIVQEGFDYVIMGHRHKAEKTHFGREGGAYINLGHWLSLPATYAAFDGVDVHLKQFPHG
jgi:UDP-2,3-diacylglucosamine hydrolase